MSVSLPIAALVCLDGENNTFTYQTWAFDVNSQVVNHQMVSDPNESDSAKDGRWLALEWCFR